MTHMRALYTPHASKRLSLPLLVSLVPLDSLTSLVSMVLSTVSHTSLLLLITPIKPMGILTQMQSLARQQ